MNERSDGDGRLRQQLERWRAGPRRIDEAQTVDLRPASAYEAVTRQMVTDVRGDLEEIKGRLNGLLWMVASAIVLDLAVRVAGLG